MSHAYPRARSRAFPFPPSWTTVLRFASCRYRTRPRSCSCLQREAKSAGYWIDLQRGTVIASYPFDQAASLSLAGSGSTVLAASFYPGGGRTIAALTPLEDGTVEARYGWTQAETVVPVDADAFAFGFMDDAGALTEEARILPADAIVAALRDGATLLEHASDNGELCTPERAAATLPLRASRMLLAVERAKDGFYALLSSDYLDPAKLTNLLIEFDSTGAERARSPIEVDGSDVYMQLSGSLATAPWRCRGAST